MSHYLGLWGFPGFRTRTKSRSERSIIQTPENFTAGSRPVLMSTPTRTGVIPSSADAWATVIGSFGSLGASSPSVMRAVYKGAKTSLESPAPQAGEIREFSGRGNARHNQALNRVISMVVNSHNTAITDDSGCPLSINQRVYAIFRFNFDPWSRAVPTWGTYRRQGGIIEGGADTGARGQDDRSLSPSNCIKSTGNTATLQHPPIPLFGAKPRRNPPYGWEEFLVSNGQFLPSVVVALSPGGKT